MSAKAYALAIATLLTACTEPAAPTESALGEGRTLETTDPVLESPRMRLLPAASQEVLRASRLPLMLPRDPQLLASAIVTSGPSFSALSAQGDGFSLSVSGTDRRFPLAEELPPPDATDQVRGTRAIFTVNDGIRTVSWDEASIAWAVDVECEDVESDARCADDDFVRALAESLELVGGGP